MHFCAPRIRGEQPTSSKESPNIHPREMDASWHTIQRNSVSTLSSSTAENGNTSFYYGSAAQYTEPEQSDGDAQDPEETDTDAHPPDMIANNVPQYDYRAALGSGSACSEHAITFTEPTPIVGQSTNGIVDVHTSNIVIFGETGVGKSSVINLIAGQEVARTSNDALGCTFQHERHTITLDGMSCALWDTAGLEEGSEGRVPAALAESNLRVLIQELAHAGGIHLVIYCIRAGRATKALQRSYRLFYVTVCRKKVPVALVVTSLEHQEGGMETWWYENEGELRRSGMRFDAHACVTTLDDGDQITRNLRADSQDSLRKLVLEYSRFPPWKIKSSFISWVLPTFRDVLRRTFSAGRQGNPKTIRKVIICDMAEDSQPPFHLSPGISAVWQRFDGLIGDTQYEFVRMDKRALQVPTSASQHVAGVGAGVLVFYTSALVDTGISSEDVDALKTFYDIAGGQTCPVIVVLRGCDDGTTARMLWGGVTSRHSGIHAHLTFLPSTVDGQHDAQVKLNEVIERLCIEHVEVVPSGFSRTGRRFLAAFVEGQFAHVTEFVAKRAKQLTPIP